MGRKRKRVWLTSFSRCIRCRRRQTSGSSSLPKSFTFLSFRQCCKLLTDLIVYHPYRSFRAGDKRVFYSNFPFPQRNKKTGISEQNEKNPSKRFFFIRVCHVKNRLREIKLKEFSVLLVLLQLVSCRERMGSVRNELLLCDVQWFI